MDSLLEQKHQPYFVQKVSVSSELKSFSRTEVMTQLCANKRVLHVGCVDFPITNLQENLHITLDQHCLSLDGFDINSDAFQEMAPYLKGELLDKWENVKNTYDIVLVPEVLEHVGNVEAFLGKLSDIDATTYIITVPDAYQCFNRHFDYNTSTHKFVEVVHPDHNCWYTPYTFQNTIKKYTNWDIKGIWFYNNISLLMIATKNTAENQERV